MDNPKEITRYFDPDDGELTDIVLVVRSDTEHKLWFDAKFSSGDGAVTFRKIEQTNSQQYKLPRHNLEDLLEAIHMAATYLRDEGYTVTVFSDEFKDLLAL